MHLFNPVSGVRFDLPSSTTLPPPSLNTYYWKFPKYYIQKAVISSDPATSTDATTVLIIYHGSPARLAFCKLGDKAWTPLESPRYRYYMDATYYKHQFYALSLYGTCDIIDTDATTIIPIAKKPIEEWFVKDSYLIESNGHLFMAVRQTVLTPREFTDRDDVSDSDGSSSGSDNVSDSDGSSSDSESEDNSSNEEEEDNEEEESKDEDDEEEISEGEVEDLDPRGHHRDDMFKFDGLNRYTTIDFAVYKLEEESDGSKEWIPVEDIGNNVFFVSHNTSFSIPASNYMGRCKPNDIYFTDRNVPYGHMEEPRRHDIGVFSYEDINAKPIIWEDYKPMRPLPFWFTPGLPS